MHKVESKYKNPDKYIKGLKCQIRNGNSMRLSLLTDRSNTIRNLSSRLNVAKGELISEWEDNNIATLRGDSFVLGKLKPKEKVAMIGIVKKVSMSTCASGNEESEIEYELIETRRLPE